MIGDINILLSIRRIELLEINGYCTIYCNNIYSSHKPNVVSYSCLTDSFVLNTNH